MKQQSIQLDPLDSPFPIPWSWVMATLSEGNAAPATTTRYYRSQSLLSPDGQFAAYSRIQMQVSTEFTQCQISSVLFVENLKTGDLQTIAPSSPFSNNPFITSSDPQPPGTIAILIPVAWSAGSDRILAREFESLFGTDIASDFAVVWDRVQNQIVTLAPTGIQYTNAILLGWSQIHRDHILFKAGMIGDEEWPVWTVDLSGVTNLADGDRPITYGQIVTNIWAGPQAHR